MASKSPEMIEVNSEQVEAALQRADERLSEEDAYLLRRIVESYDCLTELVEDKNTSLRRLRKLLFGSKTEKASNVLDSKPHEPEQNADAIGEADSVEQAASASIAEATSTALPDDESLASHESNAGPDGNGDSPSAPRGHGRNGAKDYVGATEVQVSHQELEAGDACPECLTGTVYEKEPRVIVRIVGQAPLGGTVYRLQHLRCHLCGKGFTASPPPEAGGQKYDVTASSMIALLKYGSGLPFNRLDRLQRSCDIPLPASTQWDIVNAAASILLPAYDELIRQAAQGEVLHNDDTTVRILELMGERAVKHPPEDDKLDPKRTGMFTSGVVSVRAGVRIGLFFSGRQHAGENLEDVLKCREAELDNPIHMCDGLARNLPRELEVIVANCLAHGRRKFVDLVDRFPDECRHTIEALGKVYHHDQTARDEGMSAEARLAFHQQHSKLIMDDLHQWLQRKLDEKQVEPNSALGEAIQYMLKRWGRMTVFLRKAGAPLDNNTCERALKKAILHRKNSMFYKTRHGSRVGDLYMSLIYTCELADVNAFDYLNQLQSHASEVAMSPECWMPWNFHDNTSQKLEAA